MSDDNKAFPNAFFNYFSIATVWLLCIWHILHAWAFKARKLIKGKENNAFRTQLMSNLSMLAQ